MREWKKIQENRFGALLSVELVINMYIFRVERERDNIMKYIQIYK